MYSLKMPLAAALLVSGITIACPTPSLASDADFTLRNKTGYQIDEVYVSARSTKSWGKDIMGSGALDDDEKVNIVIPHGSGACRFDLKVKYHDDGSTAEWSDVNLCEYETITLFWDRKNEVTRAVGE